MSSFIFLATLLLLPIRVVVGVLTTTVDSTAINIHSNDAI